MSGSARAQALRHWWPRTRTRWTDGARIARRTGRANNPASLPHHSSRRSIILTSTEQTTPRTDRRLELAVIAVVAVLGWICIWWLGTRTAQDALEAAVAMGGAAATAALLPRYAPAALGVVFLLSSISLLDIELSVGRMRLEQPAIVALVIGIFLHRDALRPSWLRDIRGPVLAAAVYLAASAASSAFVAPDPTQSLRLVLWTALSMLGGLGAYWLTVNGRAQPLGWFAGTGVFMSIVGLLGAVAFYLNGQGTALIFGPLSGNPKIQALAFEANLYASLLSATAFFAIERFRERRTLAGGTAMVVILAAIGVGITRGAYIGLAVGVVVYAAVLWRRIGFTRVLRVVLVGSVVAAGVGMIIGAVLMDVGVRDRHLIARGEPVPQRGPRDELATLDFRLIRIGPALEDLRSSPLIGTGLASLDQLHPLPDGELNYINILVVSTLHDSGIIGAVALSAFFGLLLLRLWHSSSDPARAGPAAAYLGALITLLVAYQATNAIHFALNWLIAGAALGLTTRAAARSEP